MNKRVLIVTISTLLSAKLAYATICGQAVSDNPACTAIAEPAQNIAHCANYMFPYSLCYTNNSGQYKKFHICSECDDGYILTVNPDFTAMGCSNGVDASVYICQPCSVAKTCDPKSEIKYDANAWKDSWTGYQSNIWTECNTNTCTWNVRTEYRCSTGYYGTSSEIKENYIEGFGVMGMTGCTACPYSDHATLGTSDPGDNETIQRCYLTDDKACGVDGCYQIIPSGSRCYHD